MTLKYISLLSKTEYLKYKSVIPNADEPWWLKTPCRRAPYRDDYVFVVNRSGSLTEYHHSYTSVGVRPVCTFAMDPSDELFWYSPEKIQALIGSIVYIGGRSWIVLDTKPGELFLLCDFLFEYRSFDSESNDWGASALRCWLESVDGRERLGIWESENEKINF